MNHSFYVYPVINEVVVLIKFVEKNEMLKFHIDVTDNQHTIQSTDTERHMWDSVNC